MSWAPQVEERVNQSKRLASWAPGLVEAIIQAMVKSLKIKALSKKDRDDTALLEAHFMAGHIPFRRDCLLCVESMGRDCYRKRQITGCGSPI